MLQASSQYLRPEYMAVPPATMDTKSSPLALLAQTCSAIGADTTNPKLLAANIEKSTKSLKSNSSIDGRDKSSPVSSHSSSVSTGSVEHQQVHNKATFKPYESNNNHMRDRHDLNTSPTNLTNNSQSNSHKVKTPKNNGQLPYSAQQQRCDSNQSASSQRDSPAVTITNGNSATTTTLRKTPTGMAMDLQQRFSSSPQRTSSIDATTSASSQLSPTNALRAPPPTSSSAPTPTEASFAVAMAKEASYMKALHAAAAAASASANNGTAQSNASSSYYPGYSSSAAGMSYPMDLMTASALMSPHHPMFKAAALNPYLNYARLKGLQDPAAAAAAAAMMTPNICRDPYCTGCPASPHYINKAAGQPCPAGCPQCEGGSNNNSNSLKSNGPNSSAAAAAAASSYHAQLAALAAASQMPYVCSWIGGDTPYCGKRFSTSDELFQHLRTHTASMPESVLTAAAAGGIPPNHPLFQRTYPTPPLSPLSAARYHPYGKPSMLPPSLAPPGALAGLPMPPHPALAQYFSPYALYGPRMGSSHP